MPKHVLDIGNCVPDHSSFKSLVSEHFGAQVTPVDNLQQAQDALASGSYDLIIVNRLLDRDGSEGLAVIEEIRHGEHSDIPIMMITNYEEHQVIAQNAGAVRGFGKSSLRNPETVELLREFLG